MPECMPGYPCFMQYLYCVMFVAAMLDDLSLDPWPGLSDEELATYLLKERLRGSMGQTSSMHLLNLFADEGRC